MTWDTSLPLGSESAATGDDRIRELKTDIQTALRGADTDGTEAKFPGADTANPVFRYRGLKGVTSARPASGQYGLYFDSTRNVLQRDNGSSWDDIGTVIPSGTVMVFYQAAAPTGWTKLATQNDKALRVVSGGSGGSAGGTNALSTAAHTHTIASDGAHTHTLNSGGTQGGIAYSAGISIGSLTAADDLRAHTTGGGDTITKRTSTTDSQGAHTHGGVSGSGTLDLAYIDVILCSKD